MSEETIRKAASTAIQPLDVEEALNAWDEDKWEAREASNRAAFAKEVGAVPWSGFATSAQPKVTTVSKEQREAALKRWLDAPLQPPATNVPAAPEPENRPEESAPAVLSKITPTEAPNNPAEAVEEAIRTASSQRELRQDCPSFWTNKALANSPDIQNDTELKAHWPSQYLNEKARLRLRL